MKKVMTILCSILIAFTSVSHAAKNYPKKGTVNKNVKNHKPKYIKKSLKGSAKKESADESDEDSAEEEESPLSGTFDITSNYVFRGVSESNNLPAVQGGFTYTIPKVGVYFTVWGSNVNFLDENDETVTLEADTTIGIAHDLTDDLSYDISFSRYNYPNSHGVEYSELIAILQYKCLIGTLGYSPNVVATGETGVYYSLGIDYEIPPKYVFRIKDLDFLASIGHYALPEEAGHSYSDYMVGLSKRFHKKYKITVQWTGTDGRLNLPPLDRDRIVGTLGVEF